MKERKRRQYSLSLFCLLDYLKKGKNSLVANTDPILQTLIQDSQIFVENVRTIVDCTQDYLKHHTQSETFFMLGQHGYILHWQNRYTKFKKACSKHCNIDLFRKGSFYSIEEDGNLYLVATKRIDLEDFSKDIRIFYTPRIVILLARLDDKGNVVSLGEKIVHKSPDLPSIITGISNNTSDFITLFYDKQSYL